MFAVCVSVYVCVRVCVIVCMYVCIQGGEGVCGWVCAGMRVCQAREKCV